MSVSLTLLGVAHGSQVMDNSPEQLKDPLIGTLFANRYRIDRLKTRGAMSTVYRAIDTESENKVAIKLLNGLLLTDDETMQRFHREARIARALTHPNICALFDHGLTADGTPYQVLEYVDGENLEEILAAVGSLNPVEALPIFIKACRAVQYLHTRGVVHRDLKPANLMIPFSDGELSVKIIDFGVAKGTTGGIRLAQQLTKPGEVFGSLLYTAPERLNGCKADSRSDVYSLGCVIYEALTGYNPFAADEPTEIADKQLRHFPESLQSLGLPPKVAILFQPIVTKAMEKNPNRRYQTGAELKAALEKIDRPLRIVYALGEQSVMEKRRAESRKRFKLAGVMVACLIAAVSIVIVGLGALAKLKQSGANFPPHW